MKKHGLIILLLAYAQSVFGGISDHFISQDSTLNECKNGQWEGTILCNKEPKGQVFGYMIHKPDLVSVCIYSGEQHLKVQSKIYTIAPQKTYPEFLDEDLELSVKQTPEEFLNAVIKSGLYTPLGQKRKAITEESWSSYLYKKTIGYFWP